MPIPDPDLAAQMYESAAEFLERRGYVQYEISNWALDGAWYSSGQEPLPETANPMFACRHNLQYWQGDPYLGFGAGAHGYAAGMRYSNVLRIRTYIERLQNGSEASDHRYPLSPAAADHKRLSPRTVMQESMLTGLRLTRAGISAEDFSRRFGAGQEQVFAKEVADLVGLGLLEWTQGRGRLRLTRRGHLLGNQVFIRFVGD
jgi:oxygen-independent coproporphyrinogen-3 oxidase